MNDRAALLRQLAELERPLLAKCASVREQSEDRAARLYAVGVDVAEESQRAIARRYGIDERMVRDYLDGARAVPLWAVLALPRESVLAIVRTLLEQLAAEEERERGAA